MRGLVRLAGQAFFACAVVLAFAAAPAHAAERRMIVTKDADYAGFDYKTIKDTTFPACQAACVGDNQCRAVTFNNKAGWCFLKSDFGNLAASAGATAGRITENTASETLEKQRLTELDFLQGSYVDEARRFAGNLKARATGVIDSYATLAQRALAASRANRTDAAVIAFTQMLSLASEDPEVWMQLAQASLDRAPTISADVLEARTTATNAALNAYLRAETVVARARALSLLASALQRREAWRPAIRALSASLALREDQRLRTAYNDLVRTRGFRIASHEVDADSETPQICLVFSDQLPADGNVGSFVSVDDTKGLSVEAKENQICIGGVKHGGRYHIRVRQGLPNADGDKLPITAELDVFVRDRAPWVGFAGSSYVLPAGQGASIPIQSINTDKAAARIFRIGDRNLNQAIKNELFRNPLEPYRANDIADDQGELVWEGEVGIKPVLNEMVTTAIPIGEALKQLRPGAYVITARIDGVRSEDGTTATQWFVVSDLGLTTLTGSDGIHALVRSLGTAKAVAGARAKLVAVNNEVLGTAVTDAEGHAVFAPGLARGKGGNEPSVLVVETDGDYGFIDLRRSAFDLSDRGVAGRQSPGNVDVFVTPERGIYRPGETVHLTALARDSRAAAIDGLPLTLVVERPDGVEYLRRTLADQGAGGYVASVTMRSDAMRGAWRIAIHADPKGAAVTETSVLVEDFEPERLAFEAKTEAKRFALEEATNVAIDSRYLYGAPAAGLTVEGEIVAVPVRSIAGFNGYFFGRADDKAESSRETIDAVAETDKDGKATLEVELPDLPETTRPLRGDLILRMTDTNGRAVERKITLPIELDGARLGVKPLFDGGVPEGQPARFELVMVNPDGQSVAAKGVKWSLSRLETRYQWYRDNSIWKYEPITNARRVGDGTLDLAKERPGAISAPVEWGRYRLEVTSTPASKDEAPTSSSVEFSAGWYVAQTDSETPDVLSVALDKPAYRAGETAKLRLQPQFAGTALIMVVDDRLIAMKAVEVPAGGASVDLPVTDDWGPGAYVTAALYRPMDVEAKRMPARALGLAWAKVDPGARDLSISLGVAPDSRPRGRLAIPVSIDNLAPGTDAYVTVAAVDLGILNITNFKTPAPDDYYFAQRELGLEVRDLYGQLIDRMQGVPGTVRSGGDGAPTRLGSPPPTQKLVAFHSGVKKVGPDGKVEIGFDIPDFNGTVRVMAIAWSKNGVGHAAKDVFVRDPVVVSASLPRFLHTGDKSRLMVELTNVSGAVGEYKLAVESGSGIGFRAEDRQRTLTLAVNQKVALNLPITGAEVGDHGIKVTLTMPGGEALPKELMLGVRPSEEPVTRRNVIALAPNGKLTLDGGALSEFVPGTADVLVSVGGAGKLDIPGLLASLDRYPYGCAEQITSRALPLVYLNEVAKAAGLAEDEAIKRRVQDAIAGVLAKQTAAGGFGLWGPSEDNDLWLSSYVTDFITRAGQNGYDVPPLARTSALDNLANRVAYAQDFNAGGQAIAYALYVLARNGRAAMGDLRYYVESKLDAFTTPLAKAQLGAALALYGDRQRSQIAFRAATRQLSASTREDRREYRLDYGSYLRDGAAVLTLAAETKESSVDTRALVNDVVLRRDTSRYLSTQEEAWMLLAAAALIRDTQSAQLTINGQPMTGSYYRKFDGIRLAAAPVVVQNTGTAATDASVSLTGSPVIPEPAGGSGFKLERTYYRADGKVADIKTVGQNERFVVVLTVTADAALAGRLMVVDPLPAGFEIENSNISSSGDTSRYEWLEVERDIQHSEARTDRFVAALNRASGDPVQFKVAYSVRAVSPGSYAHPAATVEDMYRPDRRARTASTAVEVVGVTR